MSVRLGMQAKLYRNSGTFAVPTWVEVANVRDLTLSLESGEADVTTRANNGWRATVATLKEGSIEFEMVWDTEDPNFNAVQSAFFNNTGVELAVMDGAVAAPGSQGLRATMSVTNFSRGEPLEEAITASVSAKPTFAANAPFWYRVESIDAGEPTTASGANLYLDSGTGKATFTAGGNTFIGVTVQDYTTGGTLVYFDATAQEV